MSNIKDSGVNPDKTFDNFDVNIDNGSAYTITVDLAEKMGRISKPLYLSGPVGRGKSHLLQAMANLIMDSNDEIRVRYITIDSFDTDLYKALEEGKRDEFRSSFEDIDILIIDDISQVMKKMLSKNELFKIMKKHKEAGKLIIASDTLTLEELAMKGLPEGYIELFKGASKIEI